jgi:hypothetical protein
LQSMRLLSDEVLPALRSLPRAQLPGSAEAP